MFLKKSAEKTKLEDAIDELLAEMNNCEDAASERYDVLSTRLEKLYKLKEIDQKSTIHENVSADVAVKTGGMLLGIAFIVVYEQKNIFGSKAMSLVQKIL